MRLLVPIDGSDVSFEALRCAADFARRHKGTIHVVHFTDECNDATDRILERAREVLAAEGVEEDEGADGGEDVSLVIDVETGMPRGSYRVGRNVVELVEGGDYDHVVMGHHGMGSVEYAILGSAAETVLRNVPVPVTVVPERVH